MPALPSITLPDTLVNRNAITTSPSSANTTRHPLQVVCAWPVSGQYGPGSRVLYYVLVAVCVFAQDAEWLKKVCLAAALLFPAVAAIHAIVLAAIHVDGAVDMDVYGAFQLCSIGILAAQVTVRNSRKYFNAPGRNTIFAWTGLILAGLLSLTVEFYRIKASDCLHDDFGNPISSNSAEFPYRDTPQCGLTCSVDKGPYSPLRGGSTNNIYVIPVPDSFTFGTAILISAACCIPAILSLMWMWNKILKINWNTRWNTRSSDGDDSAHIDGTNGATVQKMKSINGTMRHVLGSVEIIVFGGAVLAIIIIGERNFFSTQVRYQTEPIASIGQWAPIVGTGLAAIGSLYLLLARDVEDGADQQASMHDCNGSSLSVVPPGATDICLQTSNELQSATNRRPSETTNVGGHRRKVTDALIKFSNYFSSVAYDRFDDSGFRRGNARHYPQVPGEEHRNGALPWIVSQYNSSREADQSAIPTPCEQRSRAASFNGNNSSGLEGSSTTPRAISFQSPPSPQPTSSVSVGTSSRRPDPQNAASSSRTSSAGDRPQMRPDTLQVPSQVHRRTLWD